MQINETLFSKHVISDDKARRVLNTAPDKPAGITINELERGVTIEQLENLKVPVYSYATQITIHGTFRDIPDDLRVCGCKSIIRNQNKSLGVRYVAVDGAKKELIEDVARYNETGKWHVNLNSQGCEVYKIFHTPDNAKDKQDTIDCYNSTPDTLYIGSKRAVSLMYGGYAVIMEIGAIYDKNLWAFINAVTGIASPEQFEQVKKDYELERERRNKAWQDQCELEKQEREIKLANAIANFKVPENWKPFNGNAEQPGIYAHIRCEHDYLNGGDHVFLKVFNITIYRKKLHYTVREFNDFIYIPFVNDDITPRPGTINIKNGWIIQSEVKQDKPEPTAPKPLESPKTGNQIIISKNDKLNGIEVKFQIKPDNTVISKLKQLGFRWSQFNGLWYSRYSDNLMSIIKTELGV